MIPASNHLTTNLTIKSIITSIFILLFPGFTKNHKNLSSNFPQHVVELRRYQQKDRNFFDYRDRLNVIFLFADYGNPRKKQEQQDGFILLLLHFAVDLL